jgi:hypothetical protein
VNALPQNTGHTTLHYTTLHYNRYTGIDGRVRYFVTMQIGISLARIEYHACMHACIYLIQPPNSTRYRRRGKSSMKDHISKKMEDKIQISLQERGVGYQLVYVDKEDK